jgi:hypothetical protein
MSPIDKRLPIKRSVNYGQCPKRSSCSDRISMWLAYAVEQTPHQYRVSFRTWRNMSGVTYVLSFSWFTLLVARTRLTNPLHRYEVWRTRRHGSCFTGTVANDYFTSKLISVKMFTTVCWYVSDFFFTSKIQNASDSISAVPPQYSSDVQEFHILWPVSFCVCITVVCVSTNKCVPRSQQL